MNTALLVGVLVSLAVQLRAAFRLEVALAVLDDVKAAVAKEHDVVLSAIALLQGLKTALENAGTDNAALSAIRDQLGTDTQALADAVVANTPAAAPAPVPVPPADVPPAPPVTEPSTPQ